MATEGCCVWYMLLLIYILVIWIISIWMTVQDKSAARLGKRRVPERTLLLLGLLGGAGAMLVTMKTIHHKTRKAKFMVSLPLFLVLHLILLALLLAQK